jgi:hypothetical protein
MLASTTLFTVGVASAQTSSYSVLSEFNGTGGAYPVSNLISDAVGNLYGVTNGGGQTNENRTQKLTLLPARPVRPAPYASSCILTVR